MNKLIVLPLAVMFVLAMLSITGLGSSALGNGTIDLDPSSAMYYDYGGHPLVNVKDLSPVGESGQTVQSSVHGLLEKPVAAWYNGSIPWNAGLLIQTFPFYYDTNHEYYVNFEDLGKSYKATNTLTIDVIDYVGFFVLIAGLMALALVVGVRVFGIGTTGGDTFVLGTGYTIVWGVLSSGAMSLILQLPWFCGILYLAITLAYTLGVLSSFQGGGAD